MFSRIKQRAWSRSPVFSTLFRKKVSFSLVASRSLFFSHSVLEWLESSHYSRRKVAAVDLEEKLGVVLGSPHLSDGRHRDIRTSPRTD